MGEKFNTLVDIITNIPVAIQGVVMAFIISILRVIYDRQETSRVRICLEAMICGCLTLASASIISWLGLPDELIIAAGGVIGFIGVMEIRQWAIKYIDRFGPKDKK